MWLPRDSIPIMIETWLQLHVILLKDQNINMIYCFLLLHGIQNAPILEIYGLHGEKNSAALVSNHISH